MFAMRPYKCARLFRRLKLLWLGLALFCFALLSGLGCSGTDPGEGADLFLRVEGAQLVRAGFPGDEGGPEISFADFRRNAVRPGEAGVPLSGRAEATSFSVRIGLKGDAGYWTLPVGVEDPAVKGELTWEALLEFSQSIEQGFSEESSLELLVQAVDGKGRGGRHEVFAIPLEATQPEAALAVRLEWDANADVDLWLTDPTGIALSPKNISRTGAELTENAPTVSVPMAYIDIDSNAGCLIDGTRQETAIWAQSPPDGTYHVAVDLASPCATNRTSFSLSVWINGRLQTQVSGNLYPFDSRMTASGSGTPIPALSFSLKDGRLLAEP